MAQREAVIVEAVRTAVGRRNGRLKDWHPVDLMAEVLTALVQRAGIDAGSVEDVIVGCVMQVGEQSLNVGRCHVAIEHTASDRVRSANSLLREIAQLSLVTSTGRFVGPFSFCIIIP